MNEETKKKIEDKFPIVNSLSQKRRDAATFGYELAESDLAAKDAEIQKLKKDFDVMIRNLKELWSEHIKTLTNKL